MVPDDTHYFGVVFVLMSPDSYYQLGEVVRATFLQRGSLNHNDFLITLISNDEQRE